MNITELLSNVKTRQLNTKQLQIAPSLSLATRQLLMSQLPLLSDAKALSPQAIQLFIAAHPPVVYESADREYFAVANLRALELASLLPEKTKIAVRIIKKPSNDEIEVLCLQLELLTNICLGLSVRTSPAACLGNWQRLKALSPRSLIFLGDAFNKKGLFLTMLGINRRIS